ncbi:YqaJ viral recombinase family protein [Gulosibacter molinativorax]|uniref:Recombinase n=1 Tax=Gulosibacter molinativorax TaxID=256821 RepID=A0ABT7CB80_9MICO|nr:YqaJ viral recombinase family protein [Gulosibacter molinativorax]MDJ1372444.1 recombinase [Gulosibacter molinativorax]QUY63497.1 Recombinase [Gulosibacter molinativorax]
MVIFRPTATESSDSRPSADDFAPLALAELDAAQPEEMKRRTESFESYVIRQTRPSTLPSVPVEGAVWKSGILEELRNPRPKGPVAQRIVCSSDDRENWLAERRRGITATDAARLATPTSVRSVASDKVYGNSFSGNAFTDFGRQREPVIADWVLQEHGIAACGLLFRSADNPRHLATPDGLAEWGDEVVLAEIKTVNKPWKRIPRNYLRQVWWQQYVLGAERTLFVWERHENFVVQDAEPKSVWIDRDDAEIAKLVTLADEVLARVKHGA